MQTDAHALAPIASILVDQVRLYNKAAELSDDTQAASAIRGVEQERRQLLGEVEQELTSLGVTKDTHGTFLGAGHKAFLQARAALGNDSKSAVEEVERGEDYLRDEIRKRVADADTAPRAKAFLTAVLPRIKPGHDTMSALKKQYNS
ncbi:MAG: PA2169 family four-helix-bundle protein [Phycisphaerales bacterium]|nr:PA2169 family four-helix-bundle protein [Hyphomonadaceae bacterium]